MNELAVTILEWIATYFVHSSVLIGTVWVTCRFVPRGAAQLRELLWKFALVGGLVSATIQYGADVAPLGGAFDLTASNRSPALSPTSGGPADPVRPEVVVLNQHDVVVMELGPSAAAQTEVHEAGPTWTSPAPPWIEISVAILSLGSLLALMRLGLRLLAARRRLTQRVEVEDRALLRALDELRQGAGVARRVRLTCSDQIQSPVALSPWEICLPRRALVGLSAGQQRSMLAHELAHLVRRDPAWSKWALVVEAMFFFQPFNRLARHQLRETAEVLCDDWAVRRTGGGRDLATCLAEVAGWLDEEDACGPVASAMAGDPSSFVFRVRRLLKGRAQRAGRAWVLAGHGATWLALAAVALVVPGASRSGLNQPPAGRGLAETDRDLEQSHRCIQQPPVPSGRGDTAPDERLVDSRDSGVGTPVRSRTLGSRQEVQAGSPKARPRFAAERVRPRHEDVGPVSGTRSGSTEPRGRVGMIATAQHATHETIITEGSSWSPPLAQGSTHWIWVTAIAREAPGTGLTAGGCEPSGPEAQGEALETQTMAVLQEIPAWTEGRARLQRELEILMHQLRRSMDSAAVEQPGQPVRLVPALDTMDRDLRDLLREVRRRQAEDWSQLRRRLPRRQHEAVEVPETVHPETTWASPQRQGTDHGAELSSGDPEDGPRESPLVPL